MAGSAVRRRSRFSSTRFPDMEICAYEDKHYRIGEGEAMLVLVPHNHRYWLEDGGRWEFFWISMNGEEALRLHRSVMAVTGPVLHLKPRTVETLADCSLRMMEGEGETPGAASALAYRAAMALYDDVFAGTYTDATQASPMAPVIRHILNNLQSDLSVDELAGVAGLSRAHFSRVFTATEGTTAVGICAGRANASRCQAARRQHGDIGQGSGDPDRLFRPQLFLEGIPAVLRRQPHRVPHHRHVCDYRPSARIGEAKNVAG